MTHVFNRLQILLLIFLRITSIRLWQKGVFLPTTHKLTPHIKGKKNAKKKKKTLHPLAADFQLKKKEKREKENEEGRKLRPTASLDLAGHQDPQLGLASVFLGFFPFGGFGFFLWF
jgi:hypothetical protein